MSGSAWGRAAPAIRLPCSSPPAQSPTRLITKPRRYEGTRRGISTRQMKPTVSQQLNALMRGRILVLDGAMGTMIQREKLTEAEFRGERFRDHAQDLRGDN